MAQRLHFLSRGRSLAPVDVMRLEKAVPCFPHTCSGVKCFRFFDCFSAAKLQLQTARSRQELSNEYLAAKFGFDTAEKKNESSKVCQKVVRWLDS